jgi:HPt (histidine-containing phosphotransfer) domain-containing protein
MYRHEPVVEASTLQRLSRLGGDGFVADMVQIFTTQVPIRVTGAVAALDAGDLDGVRRHAHALVSTAGNLGARRLQHLAALIEQAAATPGDADLSALVPQLHSEFVAAQAALTTLASEVAA